MLPCEMLFRLLLVGVCLCVFGNTVQDIQKENEHSLGGRSLRIVGPTKDSLDAESKPGARKKFRRMFDRENIYKAVLKRTLRDTLGDINVMLHEEARRSSSTRAPNPSSPIPTPVSLTTQTFTLLSTWERQGPVMPTSPELFFPDIGEDSMLKEDSAEGLWTEAPRPSGDTAPPPSQDDTTEGTMSSESLPLIFEPLEESATQLPAAVMATAVTPLSGTDSERVVATETDKPPCTGSLMTADGQLLDTSNQSDDPDEGESSEQLMEDEGSEEDPTETAQTQPPYSLIPPPSVWVQHNQGLSMKQHRRFGRG
ncbi:uncharacterized protein armh4 isoform X2 [Hippocampus comes]|uniref:uncharacterized protein armh4 isoform X2 n=1 Tax=Hippocampus comes TaxID=109280 RepID=UPI00094E7299|nr:PREDICTED: uncharacterized protein C14orf37 homolog isoform X2 [Hippocampus comes]